MKAHQKVFKLTSTLMLYPQRQWIEQISAVKEEISTYNNSLVNSYLNSFIHYLETTPFEQLCLNYVYTFDFHGVTTLNLTYNVFKDSRKRGEALVKLRQILSDSDLEAESDELPDYLPMILEFVSVADEKYAIRLLRLHMNSLKHLEQELVKNDSPYHFLLKAIIEVSLNTFLKNEQISS